MASYIVTASTSVVLVDTTLLTSGQSVVVLLSSQVPPGRNVTIRDSLGYLSSPQSIIVSTMNGLQFTDGTSSLSMTTRYASLTVSSRDAYSWNIVNTFAFPLNQTVANVYSLTTPVIYGTNAYIGNTLSTNELLVQTLEAQSTSQIFGPLFVSTLVVGVQPDQQIPYQTIPGYNAYIMGNSYTLRDAFIGGNLTTIKNATFSGDVYVGSSLNISSSLQVNGPVSIQGGLLVTGNGNIECGNIIAQSSLSVLGSASFNSNMLIQSNVQVGGSLTTTSLQTSSIQITGVTGYIQLGGLAGPTIRTQGNGILLNAPIYTSLVSTQSIEAPTGISTAYLTVLSNIDARGVSQFLLSSATIQNSNGSLITSSIQTNAIQVLNSIRANSLTASSFTTSSCFVQGSIVTQGPSSFISTGTVYTSSMNVSFISSGSIQIGSIQTPAVEVSSLTVFQSFQCAPAVSTIFMNVATIDNSLGSFYTNSMNASSVTTSSLAFQSGILYTPNTLTINSPNTYFQTANTSTIAASTIQTSSITVSKLTIGNSNVVGNGPNFFYSTVGQPSTNILITGGPGDYLSPYFLSNIVPSGQNPTQPYTSYVYFQADYKGSPIPPGTLIQYTANFFWGGGGYPQEINSYVNVANGPSFFGASQSNQTVSGTINASSFSVNAFLYGNSKFNITYNFTYNQTASYIDSNNYLEFNSGRLNWMYALNGTTIQNSLNDMSIRNVYYYGSLNFASDPRVKTDIEDADLGRCYETIRSLPLRRYKYNDDYCSTFQIGDTHRLGFLATDLLPHFPKSVQMSDSLYPSLSTPLMTIDTAQIEMAHLGATKYLMGEVDRLEGILSKLL
jgi:hypothetical protein